MGEIMIEKLILNYVNKITKEDIINFGIKNGITLDCTQTDYIFYQVKNNWRTIVFGNPANIFNELKNKVDDKTYQKIKQLYFEFKNKYSSYL